MSDFPFKKGDLIEIKSQSFADTGRLTMPAVVISVQQNGYIEVLVEDVIKLVHRNFVVTPRIKAVKLTGGLK